MRSAGNTPNRRIRLQDEIGFDAYAALPDQVPEGSLQTLATSGVPASSGEVYCPATHVVSWEVLRIATVAIRDSNV